jgi:hypothetical protein
VYFDHCKSLFTHIIQNVFFNIAKNEFKILEHVIDEFTSKQGNVSDLQILSNKSYQKLKARFINSYTFTLGNQRLA